MQPFVALSGAISLALFVAMMGLKGFAFIDACIRPLQAYPAAGKQTKPFWLVLLGLSLLVQLIFWDPISLFNIVGTVVSAVYLAGVRPALREIGGRRGGRNEGPYGPW